VKIDTGKILGSQRVSIGATMLVSFVAALGIMVWQRRHEMTPVPTLGSSVDRPAPRRLAEAPTPAVLPPATGTPVATAAPAADASEDLPVRTSLRRPAKLGKTIVRVYNSSNEPLSLEVRIQSAESGRTVSSMIDLIPFGPATIGGDEGDDLKSGDQVTLRSQSFHDLVIQIP
jgi:hypothetical protein